MSEDKGCPVCFDTGVNPNNSQLPCVHPYHDAPEQLHLQLWDVWGDEPSATTKLCRVGDPECEACQ